MVGTSDKGVSNPILFITLIIVRPQLKRTIACRLGHRVGVQQIVVLPGTDTLYLTRCNVLTVGNVTIHIAHPHGAFTHTIDEKSVITINSVHWGDKRARNKVPTRQIVGILRLGHDAECANILARAGNIHHGQRIVDRNTALAVLDTTQPLLSSIV